MATATPYWQFDPGNISGKSGQKKPSADFSGGEGGVNNSGGMQYLGQQMDPLGMSGGENISTINKVLDPANIFGGRGKKPIQFDPSPFAVPQFQTGLDGNGQLDAMYRLTGQPDIANTLNTQGLEKLRGEATQAPGSSLWESLMNQRQDVTDQQGRDSANANSGSAASSAMSRLASSGGMSSGARERVARDAARGLSAGRQQVASNSAAARLGIGTQAESNRLGLLSALPGQELAKSSYDTGLAQDNRNYSTGINSFNIGNTLGQMNNANTLKQQTYSDQMKEWSAMQQAKATANSGKGGGK